MKLKLLFTALWIPLLIATAQADLYIKDSLDIKVLTIRTFEKKVYERFPEFKQHIRILTANAQFGNITLRAKTSFLN